MRIGRRVVYTVLAVVVIVILLVGGFFGYRYFTGESVPLSDQIVSTTPGLKLPPEDPPITPFRELHAAMLRMPDPDASEAARNTYRALLENESKQQNDFTIKECTPDPLAIKVKSGSEITIRNDDDTEHLITVNAQNQVSVPANGTAKLKAEFGKGNGIYTYRCDADVAHVGIILVKGEL